MTTTPVHINPYSGGLEPEDVAHLRRPFAVVKFMPQGTVYKQGDAPGSCRFLAHIDSSLVSERLSEVDPNWTATYQRLGTSYADWKSAAFATLCTLTVCGTAREEIGYASGPTEPMKAAYSDALKRAALRHGVGAYLRDSSWDFWMDENIADANGKRHIAFTTKTNKDGKLVVRVVKPAGRMWLQARYESLLAVPGFVKHYGEAVPYGDVDQELDDDTAAEGNEASADATAGVTTAELALLKFLYPYTGRRGQEAQEAKWAASTQPFEDHVSKVLVNIISKQRVPDAQVEPLRAAIEAARVADEAALEALATMMADLAIDEVEG